MLSSVLYGLRVTSIIKQKGIVAANQNTNSQTYLDYEKKGARRQRDRKVDKGGGKGDRG